MAENTTIGGNGTLFVGEDKVIELELVQKGSPTVAVDMSSWTMVFDVRLTDTSATAILSLTPTLTGVFDAQRSANTQRAVVTITDDNMNLFKAKTYRYSWKRMDAGNEVVLAWGNFSPQKATAP